MTIKRAISQQLPMKVDADNRIIAGDPNYDFDLASAKEFPWMVSIAARFVKYYQCSPSTRFIRSFNMVTNGVLINNQWILTSASGLYWDENATITSPCDIDPDYEETYINPYFFRFIKLFEFQVNQNNVLITTDLPTKQL